MGACLVALLSHIQLALGQTAGSIDYATARLGRTLTAVKATGPIALDGNLDERSWRGAPADRCRQ